MALSGITATQLNRDQFIAAAMRKLDRLAKGQVPDAEDLANGTQALNATVAELQSIGMPLWSLTTETTPLVAGVWAYSISNPSTNRIVQVWTELYAGGNRQELNPTPDQDFNRFNVGINSSGAPSQYTYMPQINSGTLRLWPTPSAQAALDRYLVVIYYKPWDQFVTATDSPYFPQEWNNAVIYKLASTLAPEYGIPLNDRGMLMKEAEAHVQVALDSSQEWASLYFQPDRRW